MPEPIAFLNGEFIRASALTLPVYDTGFVLGATVTEQLRTFRGELFRTADHFQRLSRSLEVLQIQLPLGMTALTDAANRLVAHNHALIDKADDLGLAVFVTPGAYGSLSEGNDYGPLVAMHTFRLAFDRWAAMYDLGCRLVTTPFQQVPRECWPAELKCRSRMHYYLADLAAHRQDPQARALLLDRHGHVTETATANVVAYRHSDGFHVPPPGTVLPGVSLMALREMAESRGTAVNERDLLIDDLLSADEVWLTSTPNCILPVVALNGQSIGDGRPGSTYRQLLEQWSHLVNVDVAGQAKRFSRR